MHSMEEESSDPAILDCQEEIVIPRRQRKKRKSGYSKFLKYFSRCLIEEKHIHMLHFINKERTQFAVIFSDKKSRHWEEEDISLFKELDGVFCKNRKKEEKYELACKTRAKSNIKKLCDSKFLREVKEKCEKISYKYKKVYEILKFPFGDYKEKFKSGSKTENMSWFKNETDMECCSMYEEDSIKTNMNTFHSPCLSSTPIYGENQIQVQDILAHALSQTNFLGHLDSLPVLKKQEFQLNEQANRVGSVNIDYFNNIAESSNLILCSGGDEQANRRGSISRDYVTNITESNNFILCSGGDEQANGISSLNRNSMTNIAESNNFILCSGGDKQANGIGSINKDYGINIAESNNFILCSGGDEQANGIGSINRGYVTNIAENNNFILCFGGDEQVNGIGNIDKDYMSNTAGNNYLTLYSGDDEQGNGIVSPIVDYADNIAIISNMSDSSQNEFESQNELNKNMKSMENPMLSSAVEPEDCIEAQQDNNLEGSPHEKWMDIFFDVSGFGDLQL